MGLLSNQLESLYGGVNQQSAEHRLNTQVAEMVNAYPTLNSGLRKRNPTTKLDLSKSISYSFDMWTHAYDRGISGTEEEKYVINIVDGDIEIINSATGDVYLENNGIDITNKPYLTATDTKGYGATTIKDFTFITNKTISPQASTNSTDDTYKKECFIWVSSANPSSAYTYTCTIEDVNGNTGTISTSDTTTTAAASAIASYFNGLGSFSATAVGSVVRVVGVNNIDSIQMGDSYGNQASYAWHYKVEFTTDLPKSLGFEGSICKVVGSSGNLFSTYWLKYEGGQWGETKQPDYSVTIDVNTMPHVLIRNLDDTFTFKPYDDWADLTVGDSETNPFPSFLETVDNVSPTIRDLFFFKNRLGFITERTVILSEVGEYGNFWRTTTAALLDSDYIDATVDTTSVISLHYATYIEDSVMLFSDKAQFKLAGGSVLSPKNVQISQTSAYEIDVNVRPLFMNDKIFFCSKRGSYTAVMEYFISQNNDTSEAVDLTAHVQTYIPTSISSLSGSPINNMLFITSSEAKDSVFVYKYYDSGSERIQSAWFKWTYNGDIYFTVSLGKNLNIAIQRKRNAQLSDWVVSSSFWNDSGVWDDDESWVDNASDLLTVNNFEVAAIFPQDYLEEFLDPAGEDGVPTEIPTVVSLGEWIPNKDIRGHIQFKTIIVSSEDDSVFSLDVNDVGRGTTRNIPSKYTVNRNPMIYGNAKNIRIDIKNSDSTGFRINTVNYEGNLTKRDVRR